MTICDAQAVSEQARYFKLLRPNFAAEYWDNVFEHFLEDTRQAARRIRDNPVQSAKSVKGVPWIRPEPRSLIATVTSSQGRTRDRCAARYRSPTRSELFAHRWAERSLATLSVRRKLEKTAVRLIAETVSRLATARKRLYGICLSGERAFHDFSAVLPAQLAIWNHRWPGDRSHNGLMYQPRPAEGFGPLRH